MSLATNRIALICLTFMYNLSHKIKRATVKSTTTTNRQMKEWMYELFQLSSILFFSCDSLHAIRVNLMTEGHLNGTEFPFEKKSLEMKIFFRLGFLFCLFTFTIILTLTVKIRKMEIVPHANIGSLKNKKRQILNLKNGCLHFYSTVHLNIVLLN